MKNGSNVIIKEDLLNTVFKKRESRRGTTVSYWFSECPLPLKLKKCGIFRGNYVRNLKMHYIIASLTQK